MKVNGWRYNCLSPNALNAVLLESGKTGYVRPEMVVFSATFAGTVVIVSVSLMTLNLSRKFIGRFYVASIPYLIVAK